MPPLADGSRNPLFFDKNVMIEKIGTDSPTITMWHNATENRISHAHIDILADPLDPEDVETVGISRDTALVKTGLMASTTKLRFSTGEGLFLSAYGNYPIFGIHPRNGVYVADHHTTSIQYPDGGPHTTLEFSPLYVDTSWPAVFHLTIVERDDFGTPGSNVEGTFRFLATFEETDMTKASASILTMLAEKTRNIDGVTGMFDLRLEQASFQPF